MEFNQFSQSKSQSIITLFTNVFSASEDKEEGQLIGNLVKNLIETTPPTDLIGFIASSDEAITGSIFFSRLLVPNSQTAFILSPVAIATSEQGKGIGQQLITHGLNHLKANNVELAFTYGDPNFYSKAGFQPISEDIAKAPFKLSYPHGWLAQSLDGNPIQPMQGKSQCVKALNDQQYW